MEPFKLADYQGSEVINMKKEIFGKQLQKATNYTFTSYKILQFVFYEIILLHN